MQYESQKIQINEKNTVKLCDLTN